MKPTRTTTTTDGLEWLRAIRRDLLREIGQTPQERAAHYQAKEKKLRGRTLRTKRCCGKSCASS